MSHLINRNTSGRLPCLHGITRFLVAAFGDTPFTIGDLKYDEQAKYNIHDFSPCAVRLNNSSRITCRYLQNPLSLARCALVQSVDYDLQKSKLASDIMNALDGLALVTRNNSSAVLTELGKKFAQLDFANPEWLTVARTAVLSYGPFVGMLHHFKAVASDQHLVWRKNIHLGYPITNETINHHGQVVTLSTGSQKDTVTRTRSILTSFAISTGFLLPYPFATVPRQDWWHVDVNEYIMGPDWTATKYVFNDALMPATKIKVDRPLSYTNLTKSVRSLRERGQGAVRQGTMEADTKIKNRRLAIAYCLNTASQKGVALKLDVLVRKLKDQAMFVVTPQSYEQTMVSELGIAPLVGLPYQVTSAGHIQPLTTVNTDVLMQGAPPEVVSALQQLVVDDELYA